MSEVATIVVGPSGDCLIGELREAARATTAPLLWILDSGAEPAPGTLDALLAVGREPCASLPVDARGTPVEAAIGRFAEDDVPALVQAAGERRVPLRHTRVCSLLVGRETVLAEAPPDPARFGQYAGNEWTARLFARSGGTLVPASTVRVAPVEPGRPLDALRAARAAGWRKGETLRELQRALAG